MKHKILIVDDDIRILDLLKQFLEHHGYDVDIAESAEQAKGILAHNDYNIMILDVMLPGVTGIEFAAEIRKNAKKMPIILLTALGDIEYRIQGLESGADDFITKPFEPKELLLRTRNLIELYINAHKASEVSLETSPISESVEVKDENIVYFGKISYDISSKRITTPTDVYVLSSTEAKLLDHLLLYRNQTVSRDTLSKIMGGLSERSIDVQIVRLRQKIEHNPKIPLYLKTVRHIGYMILL